MYRPSDEVRRKIHAIRTWGIPLSAAVSVVGIAVLAAYLVFIGIDLVASVLTFPAVLGPSAYIALSLRLSHMPPTIEGDVISFPYSVRRQSGTQGKHVRLSEVIGMEPIVETDSTYGGGIPVTTVGLGLRLRLAGGGTVFLDEGSFGGRGLDVLDAIASASAFGHSYREETNRALVGPGFPRFKVFEVTGMVGNALRLAKPIPLAGGKKTRLLGPEDILSLEPVQTAFAGPCHVVTPRDGWRFLVSSARLESLGLRSHPAWREKSVPGGWLNVLSP